MRGWKKFNRRGLPPIRYAVVLLIAAALAESVHAPLIGRSKASLVQRPPARSVMPEVKSTAVKEPIDQGTFTIDPIPTVDVSKFQPENHKLENVLDLLKDSLPAFSLLNPSPVDGVNALNADLSLPQSPATWASDPLLSSPSVTSNGGGGSAPGANYLPPGYYNPVVPNPRVKTPSVKHTAVPEPGSLLFVGLGLLGLVKRGAR